MISTGLLNNPGQEVSFRNQSPLLLMSSGQPAGASTDFMWRSDRGSTKDAYEK